MPETLVPADPEAQAVAELNDRMSDLGFPNAHAGTAIPNPRPSEFIRITSAGGAERDLVTDSPQMFIEAFAETEARAQRICAFAIAALQAAGRAGRMGSTPCYRVGVLSFPANLPLSTVPGWFRYRATISADLRRSAA